MPIALDHDLLDAGKHDGLLSAVGFDYDLRGRGARGLQLKDFPAAVDDRLGVHEKRLRPIPQVPQLREMLRIDTRHGLRPRRV